MATPEAIEKKRLAHQAAERQAWDEINISLERIAESLEELIEHVTGVPRSDANEEVQR